MAVLPPKNRRGDFDDPKGERNTIFDAAGLRARQPPPPCFAWFPSPATQGRIAGNFPWAAAWWSGHGAQKPDRSDPAKVRRVDCCDWCRHAMDRPKPRPTDGK